MYFSAWWSLRHLSLTDPLQHPIVSNELWLNTLAVDVVLMCYMNYLSYLSAVKLEGLSHSVFKQIEMKDCFYSPGKVQIFKKKNGGSKKIVI